MALTNTIIFIMAILMLVRIYGASSVNRGFWLFMCWLVCWSLHTLASYDAAAVIISLM